jgi:TetR/AcrR family transcriptional regulator, transcriptional repressor for nem operon
MDTRDSIVTAASGLVLERGAAGVTLDEVCRIASVTRVQLGAYFPDETALFREVLAQDPGVLGRAPVHQAMRVLGSLADLQEWAWLFVDQHQRNGLRGCCLLTALAGRLAAAGGDASADVGAEFGRWVTMLSESLRRMRDNGELRPETDPDELASGMVSMLQGGILLSQARNDIGPLRSAVNVMLSRARSLAPCADSPAQA